MIIILRAPSSTDIAIIPSRLLLIAKNTKPIISPMLYDNTMIVNIAIKHLSALDDAILICFTRKHE